MAKEPKKTQWKQDPEAVKADIIRVAVEQFSRHGLSGARIDEIAKQTATSKRMLYYYFGDKEGLYRAALVSEYRRVRAGEWELDLGGLDPVQAMRKLVEFTFDFHRGNPSFVRLIAIENIHHAAYLGESEEILELNQRAVAKVDEIYRKGALAGVFREGLNPLELHWAISAMCFYNVSNKHTFAAGFGEALHSEAGQDALRSNVATSVVRSMMTLAALTREK